MTANEQWKKALRKARSSKLEMRFAQMWSGIVMGLRLDVPTFHGVSVPLIREYKWHPERKWRFDFAHVTAKVAIEIEGGHWGKGSPCPTCKQRRSLRHNTGQGFEDDCEKYLEANLTGWRIIRLTAKQINTPTLERIARFILSL